MVACSSQNERHRAGISARVGTDLPDSLHAQLRATGADLSGVRVIAGHTQPRGHSVFHMSGPRSFCMLDQAGYIEHFRARAADAPLAYVVSARGIHLLCSPEVSFQFQDPG